MSAANVVATMDVPATNQPSERPEVTTGLYEWVLVMALLLCILLGTGKLLFHEWLTGGILIGFAVLLFIPFLSILKRARNS